MAGSSSLSMLTIVVLDGLSVPGFANGQTFQAAFNPTEYTIDRDVNYAEINIPGLDAPVLQYVRGGGDKVNVELFFDVTDLMTNGEVADGSSVFDTYIQPLQKLVLQDPTLHAPPRVQLLWGSMTMLPSGVAKSLAVTYSLFDVGGRPVRATAKMMFQQYTSAAVQLAAAALQSPDKTNVATVRDGDTLPAIAFRLYGDATQWRAIALANSLSDPLALVPGTSLVVPRIS
jgi:contractile injection system tube protein/LysM domain-containing protein